MKRIMIKLLTLAAVLAVTIEIGGCYAPEETIVAPPMPEEELAQCVAGFSWSQTPGTFNVAFLNQTTPSECREHRWDFGDGTGESRADNPIHAYTAAGSYIARLTSCPAPDFGLPECSDSERTVVVSELEVSRGIVRKPGDPTEGLLWADDAPPPPPDERISPPRKKG